MNLHNKDRQFRATCILPAEHVASGLPLYYAVCLLTRYALTFAVQDRLLESRFSGKYEKIDAWKTDNQTETKSGRNGY